MPLGLDLVLIACEISSFENWQTKKFVLKHATNTLSGEFIKLIISVSSVSNLYL